MLFSAQKAEVNNFSVTGQTASDRSQVLPVEKTQRHKKERRERKKQEKMLAFFDSHPEKAIHQQQQGSARRWTVRTIGPGLRLQPLYFLAAVECCQHLMSLNLL